jgi:hypothetical protein
MVWDGSGKITGAHIYLRVERIGIAMEELSAS